MMTPGEPSPRASRPPPQPKIAIVRKWREWILLLQLLQDLRKAGADDLLSDHVARGNFVKKHGDFHQHPKCRDVPRVGNWILAQLGVLLARGICGSASTPTTYGTCVETWIFSISQVQDFDHILHMLVEAIKVLQSLMDELPATMHEAVQWSGTESALQTLLQEYYPYPDTGLEVEQGDQQVDPIEVSDSSGSQEDGPNELASGSAEAPRKSNRTQGAEQYREAIIPRPLSKDRQEMVSKRLSVVLRHDKGEFQLRFDDRALVPLDDVLNLPIMYKQHIDRQQVLSAIHHNDKKTFSSGGAGWTDLCGGKPGTLLWHRSGASAHTCPAKGYAKPGACHTLRFFAEYLEEWHSPGRTQIRIQTNGALFGGHTGCKTVFSAGGRHSTARRSAAHQRQLVQV